MTSRFRFLAAIHRGDLLDGLPILGFAPRNRSSRVDLVQFDLMARLRGVCRRPSVAIFWFGDIPVASIILAICFGALSKIAALRQAWIIAAGSFVLFSGWLLSMVVVYGLRCRWSGYFSVSL